MSNMLHFASPFTWTNGPWSASSLNMSQMLPILCIPEHLYHAYYEWLVPRSPYHIKLIGVLYRFYVAYWFFPMDLSGLIYPDISSRLGDSVHVWAWKAWMKLRSLMLSDMMDPNHALFGFPRLITPWCWTCLAPTTNICVICKDQCILLGLRSIPTCASCARCRACDFESIMHIPSELKFRYSFHLSLFFDMIQNSTFKNPVAAQTAYQLQARASPSFSV